MSTEETRTPEQIAADVEIKKAANDNYQRAMRVQTTFMNPDTWVQIRAMAKVFHESKALPSCISNEAQLVMVMQAGHEMGMTPIECLGSLYIVNGQITIYGKAVTKRFREHGWKIEYKNETETSCTARVSKNRESYEETATYEMAEKSGYTKSKAGDFKVGWLPGTNRKLKLRYGALSLILKSYLPDVLGSVSEIKEVFEDIEVVAEKSANAPIIEAGQGQSLKDRLSAHGQAGGDINGTGGAGLNTTGNVKVIKTEN